MSLLYKDRAKKIVRLLEKGATYDEAGKAYNLTRQRVHQIIKKSFPHLLRRSVDKELPKE